MKVSYKGVRKALPPKLQEKLESKFSKLSKLLERRGEKEAHVVVTSERHLHNAEITVQFYDHKLVAEHSDPDLFSAMHHALENIEKQAVKLRTRWREKTRRADTSAPAPKISKPVKSKSSARVSRVNHHDDRKPMTLDEALLEIDHSQDYLVYRDAKKDGISVLVRRRDGHFDLIES